MSDISDRSDATFISQDQEATEKSSEQNSEDFSENDQENKDSFSEKTSVSKNRKKQGRGKSKKIRYIYAPEVGQPDMRKSPKFITRYEYASLIGHRAKNISEGSRIHPKYEDYPSYDLLEIAKLELDDRSIPFPLNIERPIDNPQNPTIVEIFNPHEPGILLPHEMLVNHISHHTPENKWRLLY